MKEKDEDVQITLFTEEMHECYITKFVGETFHCAVLDSGCTKNVCGEVWLNYYLETLTESDSAKVLVEEGFNNFRLGDGEAIRSRKSVTFPAKIGVTNIKLKKVVLNK